MNCKRFESLLADWVAGRVPPDAAASLADHRASCARCAQAAAVEQDLRRRWQELPDIAGAPDLWLRVSDRISAPRPLPRFSWGRSWTLGGALGGAVAAASIVVVALVSLARGPQTTVPIPGVSPADERHVISMIRDLKSYPDADRETYYLAVQDERAAERAVLIGDGSR